MFKTIVALRTGEALVFSPDSVLDVVNASVGIWDTEMALETLLDRFMKVRIRNRISADGGKSIMASDKPEQPKSASNFRQLHPIVDLTGDTTEEEEDEKEEETPTTRRVQPLRRAKQGTTSTSWRSPLCTQPGGQTSSPKPAFNPPSGSSAMMPNAVRNEVSAEDIETELVEQTKKIMSRKAGNPDIGKVRRAVEHELNLVDRALETQAWVQASRLTIKATAVSTVSIFVISPLMC
jgi:hypothetical protein